MRKIHSRPETALDLGAISTLTWSTGSRRTCYTRERTPPRKKRCPQSSKTLQRFLLLSAYNWWIEFDQDEGTRMSIDCGNWRGCTTACPVHCHIWHPEHDFAGSRLRCGRLCRLAAVCRRYRCARALRCLRTFLPPLSLLTHPRSNATSSSKERHVVHVAGVYWNESVADWVVDQSSVWTREKHESIFRSVNGLLLPGGNPWPQVSSDAVRHWYAMAIAANNNNDTFPVWGTCAGLQAMLALASEGCQSQVRDGQIPVGVCGDVGPITRGWDAKNLSSKLQWTDGDLSPPPERRAVNGS